jgi:hypothetical protein
MSKTWRDKAKEMGKEVSDTGNYVGRKGAGKGSRRRSRFISAEEETLRWALAFGHIPRREFDIRLKAIKDKKE